MTPPECLTRLQVYIEQDNTTCLAPAYGMLRYCALRYDEQIDEVNFATGVAIIHDFVLCAEPG